MQTPGRRTHKLAHLRETVLERARQIRDRHPGYRHPGVRLRWWALRGKSHLRRLRYTAVKLSRRRAAQVSRSRRLDRFTRGLPVLVMLAGLYLVLLGVAVGLGQFSAGVARLVDIAGVQGMAISSAQFIQNRVAGLLGFTPPVMVQARADPPTPAPGEGFIPYQVAAGDHEQAPALSDAAAPNTAGVTPTPPASIPITAAQSATQAQSTPGPTASSIEPPRFIAPLASAGPTSTALPATAPDRIRIPAIGLDAPVVLAPYQSVMVGGQSFLQWDAPGYFASGWQEGSAPLGQPGNTVLNGHHNIDGEVFGHLRDLKPGDAISVSAGERTFQYVVAQVMKLRERNMPMAQRQENARWIMPSSDERLTLVTCWPPENNTYRLIVVAVPLQP